MFKRFRSLMLILIALFGILLLVSCDTDDKSAGTSDTAEDTETSAELEDMEPITLSYADVYGTSHQAHVQITQGWAEAVEEATNGLVQVEVYPGESLLDSDDIYEGVISGLADVGHSVVGYNMGRFPLLGALYLGGIPYESSVVSSYVARDIVEEFAPAELDDTEIMFVYGLGPGDILSNKPVKTLEDLQGMEIRVNGEQVRAFELLGATPIELPMPNTYESLSRGVVEAAVGPIEVLEGWNLADVVDYITKVPFVYNNVHYITMNKEVWESLPDEIQEEIEAINEQMFEETAAPLIDSINESALEYIEAEFDHEIFELTEEEQEKWLGELEPLKEDYIKKLDDEGLPGEEIINRIEELAEKYNDEFH